MPGSLLFPIGYMTRAAPSVEKRLKVLPPTQTPSLERKVREPELGKGRFQSAPIRAWLRIRPVAEELRENLGTRQTGA